MKRRNNHSGFSEMIIVLLMAAVILLSQVQPSPLFAESESEKWDGATVSEPQKTEGTYQIGTGGELAWFAEKVNDGSGKTYKAVLTCDIDLGDMQWTPIGKSYSNSYSGTFSGNGHSVTGLKITGADYVQAGLFGYISGAEISGIEVSGTIEGSNNTLGGLVSRSDGNSIIRDCGSDVSVTNNAASGKAAGIVGWADGNAAISCCYNRGDIVSGDRASGIAADTGTGAVISNCYNTGRISGNKANGIGSAAGITYRNCYNAGKITGQTSAYGIGASTYADYINTFILGDTAANAVGTTPAPEVISGIEMKKASFAGTLGEAFKVDTGGAINHGFPILSWEKAQEASAVKLESPQNLVWEEQKEPDSSRIDMLCDSFKVSWDDVAGADSYTVNLYEEDADKPVFTSESVKETEYDFYGFLSEVSGKELKNYRFTVTANGDGEAYTDSDESDRDGCGTTFDPEAFIGMSEKLMWNEASKIAVWKAVPGADMYIVTLYRGEKQVVETVLDKKVIGSNTGNLSAYFLNNMALEGDYCFTVRACRTVDEEQSPNKGKVVGGRLSKSGLMTNDAVSAETVKITSAEQWMTIVNMKAAGTEYLTDADRQRVEWSKNYVLENDLDFSELSTASQVDTKSWGNVDAHFTGTLDGQGHKITGLTLSNRDAGLFEYIGKTGVVKNLTVDNANLLVSDNSAVFAHYNYGKLQNCHVINTNITTDYAGVIGPMVSRNFGMVEDCTVQGGRLVSRTTTSNGQSGFCGNNTGTIRRCWTSMDLDVASYNAGGFCGWSDHSYEMLDDEGNYKDLTGTFEDCFALGNVKANKGWSGGFVGRINSGKNRFRNCYAAGKVTSAERPGNSYGFVGSYGGEGFSDVNNYQSAFTVSPQDGMFENCFYLTDNTAIENPKSQGFVEGKTHTEMASSQFLDALGICWTRDDVNNNGLPYLTEMPIPKKAAMTNMTVSVAVATYDKNTYEFNRDGTVLQVTLPTTGNTCVIDVMDAAVEQGMLTYDYTITPAYGSFIEAINGNKLSSPDGWMFTVNDELSDVSATISKVEDGDQVLWYQGTTQNLFAPPLWRDITGEKPKIEWVDIDSVGKLVALTEEDADLTLNYRVTKDLDLEGIDFRGIGSVEKPFSGTFDGRGHEIKNLTISRPDDHNIGFFNFIRGANIRNVKLTGIDVTGRYSVGGFIGVADVKLNVNDRTASIGNNIGNCAVTGNVTSTNGDQSASSDGSYTGGFIGFNNGIADNKTQISIYSSIHNCRADVQVNAGSHYAGGFCGGNYGYITDSAATGTLTGARFSGGFLGGNEGGVYDCGSTVAVTGRDYTGGFVGTTNGTVMRCYSTGDVTGTIERNGGFLGSGSGTVKECSSAGIVRSSSSVSYLGGFAGYYLGYLSGLPAHITYADNHGWCTSGSGVTLSAIANKKSSTVEAEQTVLNDNCVTDKDILKGLFLTKHGVILLDDGGISFPKRDVDLDKVAESIYRNLDKEGSVVEVTPWIVADMAVYDKLCGGRSRLTAARKQEIVDSIAIAVQKKNSKGKLIISAGELAKDIIAMRALGYDPTRLMLAGDKGESVDLVSLLRSRIEGEGFSDTGIFVQPYVLIALSQDESYASEEEIARMIDVILESETENGGFGSADATGPVIMALAMHKGSTKVDSAVERALDPKRVTAEMDPNGAVETSFAGLNPQATVESTAQMIIAIAAAGKDPEDYMSGEATIIDGLKAFVDDTQTGFEHDYAGSGIKDMATEQGLRGILAMKLAETGGGVLYDFSETSLEIARSNVKKVEDGQAPIDGNDDNEDEKEIEKIKQEAAKKALADRKASARDEIEKYLAANQNRMDRSRAASVVLDSYIELDRAGTIEEVDALVAKAKRKLGELITGKAANGAGSTEKVDAPVAKVKRKPDELISDKTTNGTGQKSHADQTDNTGSEGKRNAGNGKKPTEKEIKKAKTDKKLNIKAGSIKTSAKTGKKTMTVKWKKVKGATNYRIAYKEAKAKKWKYMWSSGKTFVVLKKMKKKGLYQFKLQAVRKSGDKWTKSAFSKVNYRYYVGTKQKVKAGKKAVTVKAGKVKGATGYQVLYSTEKNMKRAKIKNSRKPTIRLTGLKKGKRYYVKVRPVRKYKGKTYVGVLSKARKVKVR